MTGGHNAVTPAGRLAHATPAWLLGLQPWSLSTDPTWTVPARRGVLRCRGVRRRAITDEDLLTYATNHDRALVTENVADVIPLAAHWAGAGKEHAGLVFTSPRWFNRATLAYPGNVTVALSEFLTDPPITGTSWIGWL